MSPHLTSDDLAARCGVPVETVAYWRRHGGGPAFMYVGRYVRYRRVDVEQWEQSRLTTRARRGAA